MNRWLGWLSVERCIVYGGFLSLMAAGVGVPVLYHWWRTSEVASPASWIFAGALFVIGVEIMFAGFLVGIMDLPKEQNRKG